MGHWMVNQGLQRVSGAFQEVPESFEWRIRFFSVRIQVDSEVFKEFQKFQEVSKDL